MTSDLKRVVLNKLAKERTVSGWDWETFKKKNIENNSDICMSLALIERAVDLAFEAECERVKKAIEKMKFEIADRKTGKRYRHGEPIPRINVVDAEKLKDLLESEKK